MTVARMGVGGPDGLGAGLSMEIEHQIIALLQGEALAKAGAFEIVTGLMNVLLSLIEQNPDAHGRLQMAMSCIIGIAHSSMANSAVPIDATEFSQMMVDGSLPGTGPKKPGPQKH